MKKDILYKTFRGVQHIHINDNECYVYTKNICIDTDYLKICVDDLKCKNIEVLMPHDKDMGFIYKITY